MSFEWDSGSLVCDARRACSSVQQWPGGPGNEDVVWLRRNEFQGRLGWSVVVGRGKEGVRSDTQQLADLKEKLELEAQVHFNVCQSVPEFNSDVNDRIKWPGHVNGVKSVWIDPTCCLKDAINSLIREVKDVWRDETVILHGFPLSSDFAVHVLFVVSHMFEMVGFMRPRDLHTTIILFEFYNVPSCMDLLQNVRTTMKVHDPLNMCLIPNGKFLESRFLNLSRVVDSILIKEEILDIIKNMEAAFEETDAADDNLQGQCQSLACLSKQHSRCSLFCIRMQDQLDHLSFYVKKVSVQQDEAAFSWQYPLESVCPSIEIVKRPAESVDLGKFCLKELIRCHGRVCEILKYCLELTEEEIREKSCLFQDYNTKTSMKKYPWSDLLFEVNILDFGNELWLNKGHANQPEILKRIVIILEDMWADECLELRGFPLLSEFNVSVVYLVAHLFEKIRFFHTRHGRNSIFFCKYLSAPANLTQRLQKILLRENCNSVQSIVELHKLYSPEFYDKVRVFNNVVLKEQSLYMLRTLTEEVDAVLVGK